MGALPTPSEAHDILCRFVASHFEKTDREHARFSIPANPERDDDIRMARFIDQAERIAKVANQLAAALERADSLNSNVEYWGDRSPQSHREKTREALAAYSAL